MIDELLRLLKVKNEWLLKFSQVTQNYLQQLQRNVAEAVEDIDYFLNNRQSLLSILESNDKKITFFLKSNEVNRDYLSQYAEQINALHSVKDQTTKTVEELDEKILKILNKFRKESEERLILVKRGKRALSGYRQEKGDGSLFDLQL